MHEDGRAVLVAEDDDDDRELLRAAFDGVPAAIELQFVGDGQALLETLDQVLVARRPLPALVVLDLNLPRLDGREALRAIRRHPSLRTLPVLVLSTSEAQRDVNLCYELGANTYFAKPRALATLTGLARAIHDYWLRHATLPAPA